MLWLKIVLILNIFIYNKSNLLNIEVFDLVVNVLCIDCVDLVMVWLFGVVVLVFCGKYFFLLWKFLYVGIFDGRLIICLNDLLSIIVIFLNK